MGRILTLTTVAECWAVSYRRGEKGTRRSLCVTPEEAFNPRTHSLLIYKAGVMITAPSSSDG